MKKFLSITFVIVFTLTIFTLLGGSAIAADNDETEPEFLYIYINGTYLMYPAIYNEGSALIVYPCVHSCMRCGKCLLDDPCTTFDGHKIRCECEDPLYPNITDTVFSSDKDIVKIVEYDATLNGFSPYFLNARGAVENREIYSAYYVTFAKKDECNITLQIDDESFDKLMAKRAEFWWVKDTRRERITEYVLDEVERKISFVADREGLYFVSSHLFNQALLDDAYFASEATCEEPEKYYLSCSCGASSEDIYMTFTQGEPNEHQFVASKTIEEAGCLTEGRFIKKCSVCNHEEEDILPELGHSYSKTVLTILPQETRDGEVKYFCKRCSAIYTESIPRITDETDVSTTEKNDNFSAIAILVMIIVVLVITQVGSIVWFVIRKRKR